MHAEQKMGKKKTTIEPLQKVDMLALEERRHKLKRIIQEQGWDNINKVDLAKKWGISRQMLYEDYDALIVQFKEADISKISFRLGTNYERMLDECQKIMHDPSSTKEQKLRAIAQLDSSQENYTKFLESYGKKTKVAERLALSQDPVEQLLNALKQEGAKK